MRKPKEGDVVIIRFPNVTIDVKAAKEFGYGQRDSWGYPIGPITKWTAEYEDGEWVCRVRELDETLYSKTLDKLIKQIKSWMKDDQLVAKMGPVKYDYL